MAETVVATVLVEHRIAGRRIHQMPQVEHLQSVTVSLADDVGVAGIGLDVAPARSATALVVTALEVVAVGAVTGRQAAQQLRFGFAADRRQSHEGGAFDHADQGVLGAGIVGPAPDVVERLARNTAQFGRAQMGQQIDMAAGVAFGRAIDTFGFMGGCRIRRSKQDQHGERREPANEKFHRAPREFLCRCYDKPAPEQRTERI